MSDYDEGFAYILGVGCVTTVEGVARRRAKRVPFGFRAPESSVKVKGPVARRKDVK